MKISKSAQACVLSPIRKFYPYALAAEKQGRKIYHLNIGQPDIQTPPMFFEAVHRCKQPVLEYAPSGGIPQLVSAIQHYYEKMGIHFREEDILVTTGGSEALQILMFCILDPGCEVLIPEPFYPNYDTIIRAAGGVIRPIPTTPEEGYRYAVRERIEALINDKTRAIMVTNPGNPTGVTLTHDEMRMIADLAKEKELYVIGDEVYREFYYNNEGLHSMAEFEDAAENVCIIDSVSKRFSACGARVGCLISRNQELMSNAMKFCQARLSVATLAQIGSIALYEVDESYFENVRKEYKHRRDVVMRKLKEIPGVVCTEPRGAFYLMAKLPIDNADKFQTWLLTDFEDNGETVMFAPGGPFYATPGKGVDEVRIAYVLNAVELERAMDLLALGIKAYNEANK